MRSATGALLAAALVVLAVALAAQALDVFGARVVDVLALVGLALLAVGQAIRARRERSPRSLAILLLVLALAVFVLVD